MFIKDKWAEGAGELGKHVRANGGMQAPWLKVRRTRAVKKRGLWRAVGGKYGVYIGRRGTMGNAACFLWGSSSLENLHVSSKPYFLYFIRIRCLRYKSNLVWVVNNI